MFTSLACGGYYYIRVIVTQSVCGCVCIYIHIDIHTHILPLRDSLWGRRCGRRAPPGGLRGLRAQRWGLVSPQPGGRLISQHLVAVDNNVGFCGGVGVVFSLSWLHSWWHSRWRKTSLSHCEIYSPCFPNWFYKAGACHFFTSECSLYFSLCLIYYNACARYKY